MTATATPPVRVKPYPETSLEARALNQVGDKWALLVVRALMDGPVRFVELQRGGVQGVSTEQLRVCLKRLEHHGVITRTRYREVPPRVDYELTDKGRALSNVLYALATWADEHTDGGPA